MISPLAERIRIALFRHLAATGAVPVARTAVRQRRGDWV
jgi:hypothetical protein